MYRLNKLPLCTQIVKKYYKDGPRLVLASKCYKWQHRDVNSKAVFPRGCLNCKVVLPRCQDKRLGLYLAAQCLCWQGRSASTCQDTKAERDKGKNKSGKKGGTLCYTLGFVLVGTAATIAYAESDPEFREWLEMTIPGTNEVIKVVYKEEKPYGESFKEYKEKLSKKLIAGLKESCKKKTKSKSTEEGGRVNVVDDIVLDEIVEYKAPFPAFAQLQKSPVIEEDHYNEKRLMTKELEITLVDDSTARQVSGSSAYAHLPETHPLNLMELERKIGASAEKAILKYNTAINAMRQYSKELYQLVDLTFKKPGSDTWDKLKVKAIERQQLMNEAEKEVKAALSNIERLRVHIDNPDLEASKAIKEKARKNLERILEDIEAAKKKFEKEEETLSVAQKYWKKVEDVRKLFNDDLKILFPNIRTNDKYLKMTEEEIGLLLAHIHQIIFYYEQEFSKTTNVRNAMFKQMLEDIQKGTVNVVDAKIGVEVEKEGRNLRLENDRKKLGVLADFEKMSRVQLKRQAEDQAEYLKDVLAWKEVEVERSMMGELDVKLDEIRSDYKLQVAAMTGRMKGLNADVNKTGAKDGSRQVQVLWGACQALLTALNSASNSRPWTAQLRPLQAEISAVVKAADGKDELVNSVVATIPERAIYRGVYSKAALKERFLKVKQLATRLAQVSDGGAPAFLLFLSLIESFFIFKNSDPIPLEEIANEPIDISEFTTYDILLRAKYWLERDDLEQCVRYMNLLRGAPKSIAKDWIAEAITFLETQQAADTLLAHASSNL